MIWAHSSLRRRRWVQRGTTACLCCIVVIAMVAGIINAACPFPTGQLEDQRVSALVTDRRSRILTAHVADDDQWRFPVPLDKMSPWLLLATIAVEDERFRSHAGVDPIAVLRAAGQNISSGCVVSGASTLTMQVCRMMDDRPRSWRSKIIESFRAVQLERIYAKDRILETYLNMAPYGGNICGVEAASRAYFDKPAAELALGEAALLAGLPQSPSRYHPDRFLAAAMQRRQTVLRRMAELGMISPEQRRTADNDVPAIQSVKTAPRARHAAELARQQRPEGGCTTIDLDLQLEVERLVADHARSLRPRTNIAVVAIDIDDAAIVALVGSSDFDAPIDGQVNGVVACRSPGSALKPFVYAAAFEASRLNPKSIVHDVPIERGGWAPRNFDRQYAGQITVTQALQRSLNIPAILVAEGIGSTRCIGAIESAGIRLPVRTPIRSGLSLAVGGVEVTLLDLTNGYATLGRRGVRRLPRLFAGQHSPATQALDANVCAAINDILSSRARRPRGMESLPKQEVPCFMWKTGTSSRRRDAWAVGHNHRFAIGVWVGRFSGVGNPQLVGGKVAEPLLAKLFASPGLRANQTPDAHEEWAVQRQLSPPVELQPQLRITRPADGAAYVAMSGQAVIHPAANIAGDHCWFLNGILVQSQDARRLALRVGVYELRCVSNRGDSASVSFTVRSSVARR